MCLDGKQPGVGGNCRHGFESRHSMLLWKGCLPSSNAKDLIQKQIGHLTSGFFSMPTLLHLNVIQSLSGSISNDDVDDDDDVNDDFDDNTAGS